MKIRGIFDNIEIKLICLALAIVMWLYAIKGTEVVNEAISRGDQGRVIFRGVPVELMSSRGDWEPNPKEVLLEVKCVRAEVEMDRFQAVVRLTRKNETERQVVLTTENVVLPDGLIFVKAEPNEIQIIPLL